MDIATELTRAVQHVADEIAAAVAKRRKSEVIISLDEEGRVVGDKVITRRGR